MDKIINFFKQWDKLAHTAISCVIMLFFTALSTLWFNYWIAILIGTGITTLCIFGKVFADKHGDGTPSWNDVIAGGIGWALAFIPILIIGIKLVAH